MIEEAETLLPNIGALTRSSISMSPEGTPVIVEDVCPDIDSIAKQVGFATSAASGRTTARAAAGSRAAPSGRRPARPARTGRGELLAVQLKSLSAAAGCVLAHGPQPPGLWIKDMSGCHSLSARGSWRKTR